MCRSLQQTVEKGFEAARATLYWCTSMLVCKANAWEAGLLFFAKRAEDNAAPAGILNLVCPS